MPSRDVLEEIGHAVGAFDPKSALPHYAAVSVVRQLVLENWDGPRPDWSPLHDVDINGECSLWCPACRKTRLQRAQ